MTQIPYLLKQAIAFALLCAIAIPGLHELDQAAPGIAEALHVDQLRPGAYDVLLETVAGVAGVFIGLYFTAVTAIAAAVYVRVPDDLRSLIIEDRIGSTYVAWVAVTAGLSVVLLAIHAAAGALYPLAVPLVGLLATVSIFSFVALGRRAFDLADPTVLRKSLAREFAVATKPVLAPNRGWHSPTTQEASSVVAGRAAQTLGTLVRIATRESHLQGGSSRALVRTIAQLLASYIRARNHIPTDSKFWGERYEHRNWYLADSMRVNAATAAGTALDPNTVADIGWVEDLMLGPIIAAIGTSAEQNVYDDVYLTLHALDSAWHQMGVTWNIKSAIRWTNRLSERVIPAISQTDAGRLERPALPAAATDALSFLALTIEVGFHQRVVSFNFRALSERIAAADWTDPATPYAFNLPQPVLEQAESTSRSMLFENEVGVGGYVATPGWYASERILNALEWEMHDQINQIVPFLGKWATSAADRLTDSGRHEAAASVLNRGIEIAWKLSAHIPEWRSQVDQLDDLPRRLSHTRPNWDWAAIEHRSKALKQAISQRVAKSILPLSLLPQNEDVPDNLGQAVTFTGEACFTALADGDYETFEQLFNAYLVGTLSIADRLRGEVVRWADDFGVTWSTEPVMDLMAISGYACVFGELRKDEKPWSICTRSWDAYLEGTTDRGERIRALAAIHSFHTNRLGIGPRETSRGVWGQRVRDLIEDPPNPERLDDEFADGEVDHESAVIRAFSRSFHRARPTDVFMVRYVAQQPEAQGLDLGVRDPERYRGENAPEEKEQ
ncbi:MAG TPA: hypothetical protein VFX45_02530 [Solirubrobacterales bacterium]|nr:hypothetical protein [Solirubrobacterales bacterium]